MVEMLKTRKELGPNFIRRQNRQNAEVEHLCPEGNPELNSKFNSILLIRYSCHYASTPTPVFTELHNYSDGALVTG